MYDIIPDIHGQADMLKGALNNLGYGYRNGAWRHTDPMRKCVFLGDYIDRGPNNVEVIDIVRGMVDAGTAFAIMGNHELNAIHFHTRHPETGTFLRKHSDNKRKQHDSFLRECPVGDTKTLEYITWMRSLPLFLELDGFRVVHACWDEDVIADLGKLAKDGCLTEEQFLEAADKNKKLFELVETTTKGPEAKLPKDYFITDKGGHRREEVRLQWWNNSASTWRDIAISVPNPAELPEGPFPPGILQNVYLPEAKPVFFGHYQLPGKPVLQGNNTLCLDYSAEEDGSLITYSIEAGAKSLEIDKLPFQ